MGVTEVSPTEYGLAIGGLWLLAMQREGWIASSDGPDGSCINEQRCRDIIAVVKETDCLYFKESEDDDADGMPGEVRAAIEFTLAMLTTGGVEESDAWELVGKCVERFGFSEL